MDGVFFFAGLLCGAALLAAGAYTGWRAGHLARGVEPPRITEPAFDGGSAVSLEPAYFSFPEDKD